MFDNIIFRAMIFSGAPGNRGKKKAEMGLLRIHSLSQGRPRTGMRKHLQAMDHHPRPAIHRSSIPGKGHQDRQNTPSHEPSRTRLLPHP